MASPFVRAMRAAIANAERELASLPRQLANMRAALINHEQAEADVELLKLKQRKGVGASGARQREATPGQS